MLVQRVLSPTTRLESWTVLGDDDVPVQPIERYLAYLTMMAAFAELERDIIHERTMAGLAAAKAQGKVGGRPTVMDADKLAATKARRERGESPTEIARASGCQPGIGLPASCR